MINLFSTKGEGLPQDRERAARLWHKLKAKRLLGRRSKMSDWVKEFRDLREKDGIDDQEIEETLIAYIPRISLTMSSKEEGFVPQAFSAKSFREKYLNIRARLACFIKVMEESEKDEVREKLFLKAKMACQDEGGYTVSRNARVRVKTPGTDSWRWIEIGEEKDYCPPMEVFVYIRYCRGEYIPTAEDLA